MKKLIYVLIFTLFSLNGKAQNAISIADSANIILELDLGKIIKSVPLKEINKIDFVQSLLGKMGRQENKIEDLSQMGIDFNSKLYLFTIEEALYTSETIVLPLKDQQQFLSIFSEEQKRILQSKKVLKDDKMVLTLSKQKCTASIVNWKGNSTYLDNKVKQMFLNNGWELPDRNELYGLGYYLDFYPEDNYQGTGPPPIEIKEEEKTEEDIEEHGELPLQIEEPYEEERIEDEIEEIELNEYQLKQIQIFHKYQAAIDSTYHAEKQSVLSGYEALTDISLDESLAKNKAYQAIYKRRADAKIYINPTKNRRFIRALNFYPLKEIWYDELIEMRQTALIDFTETGVQMDWNVRVSDELTEVMKEMSSKRIDKKLLRYIPENTSGVAVYNLDSYSAYEKMKEIYIPKLDKSEDPRALMASAIWSTIDEFIDMEAIASVYPPKMLFSYSGMKEVELTNISYAYDEETFEYSEKEEKYMETVPMVTFAMANERAYLLEKYIKALQKSEDDIIEGKDGYYTTKGSPLDFGIPLHIANYDDVVIISTDESYLKNHLNGAKNKTLDKSVYKKVKKSRLFYGHLDFNSLISDFGPMFKSRKADRLKELFDNKTGKLSAELSSISNNNIEYKVFLKTDGQYKNGGYFMFELLNTIFNN